MPLTGPARDELLSELPQESEPSSCGVQMSLPWSEVLDEWLSTYIIHNSFFTNEHLYYTQFGSHPVLPCRGHALYP